MKRFFLFLLVAAGLTLTAAACSSGHYYQRYPYGYPQNGGYYNGGGYGSGYDYERMRQLAYDLEGTTRNLKEEAKDSRVNGRVVDQLEDLNDKAGDFRHEVEERDAHGMSNEFRNVSKEYFEARDAIQRYSGYGYGGGYGGYGGGYGSSQSLYRDLQRVNSIMSELSRYYGYGRY